MDIRQFFNKKRAIDSVPDTSGSNSKSQKNADGSTNLSSLTSSSAPDLAPKGKDIKQIILANYPKQENNRSFQVNWYKRFLWLEYSQELNAAFCYACRQFQPNGSKGHTVYTYSGFSNWKNATDLKNGFPAHEKTAVHIKAMQMWNEKRIRDLTGTAVSTLINSDILQKYRYYVESIAEIIQFLTVNELALRGNYDIEHEQERGLFLNLFKYTIKKDEKLAECLPHIPQNAKYTSPDIQNEIIAILAEMVREQVVGDLKTADVPWFTLLEDGTKDKNNRENVSIGVRYVKNGKVFESLLGIYTTEKLDAKTFTNMTLNILNDNGIDTKHLLSQCYDGASVMSGHKGGVAALIQKSLGRFIPYVHCFNHRLHLVVVRTISEIDSIKHFFDQTVMLHEFFGHGKVAAIYRGKSIGRLLEQRWSGHIAIVEVIFSNYTEILRSLDEFKNDRSFICWSVYLSVKSVGIKSVMLEYDFRFTLVFMKKLLGLLEPADSALQARTISLKEANEIIKSVKNKIRDLRTNETYQSLANEASQLLKDTEAIPTEKRVPKLSVTMKEYLIMEKLPFEMSNKPNASKSGIEAEFFESLDLVLSLLNERFSDNDELITAISSIELFDLEKIKYLEKLGISLPTLEELAVVKDYMHKKPKSDIFAELYKQREVFKNTHALFATVYTLGCSTAIF
ncbi:uncharacterized protein LOC130897444 [Diorhabda carinulata]|uniref:uncharacterized protein LOC130897444 n=1 Tax=Diorhabda carinulata TaxID=1163345 RepID=UPI0025A2EB0A|nr:uncharacterized protein LOC130897444 [Diorhabda carinulata]